MAKHSRKKKKILSETERELVRNPIFNSALLIKLAICLQLIFLAFEFQPDITTNGDDAHYLIVAQALVHGHGYHQINVPGNPTEDLILRSFRCFFQ